MTKKTHVCLIHGLGRSRFSMGYLGRFLKKEGYYTHNFGYRSRKQSIEDHCQQLKKFLKKRGFQESEKLYFVGHSLGGLIIRAFLHQYPQYAEASRIIMLGTPNQGSKYANTVAKIPFAPLILGPSFREICAATFPDLPESTETGIIAGGTGKSIGFNLFVSGDNDGIVTVAETRLDGAVEHLRVFGLHSFLMYQPKIIRAIKSFFEKGTFSANE